MNQPIIAVLAPGNMGAAVGARLAAAGAKVLTSLAGRSPATLERARAARMDAAGDGEIARSDVLLSIVPPGEALALAERLAPALRASNHKPLYLDCNAVSPETVGRIAAVVEETGCGFADAGIIGGPPQPGTDGPRFYVSGPPDGRVATLSELGLAIRVMDGAVGDASALKMCYGGLTKGLTALGSAAVLAAGRSGAIEALHGELAASQPNLLAFLSRTVPQVFQKAYRFVDEMEEIAVFMDMPAETKLYQGISEFYVRLAEDVAGEGRDVATLEQFFCKTRIPKSN
jgi:3-hydroxyisobutyrate dehydrogenase-like beta-hydroxyacid dehydrogenase